MHATQREGTERGVDAGATVRGPAHVLHAARAVASTSGRRGVDVPLYGLGVTKRFDQCSAKAAVGRASADLGLVIALGCSSSGWSPRLPVSIGAGWPGTAEATTMNDCTTVNPACWNLCLGTGAIGRSGVSVSWG